VPFNGGMKEEATWCLFPCSGGDHGGGARQSGGGGACSISTWGGRRRPARPGGPKGRVGRVAAGLIGPEAEKNPFGIEFGILNLPSLWKFVQRDFRGILTPGFFLNSSRILKDF
jgi:hypothetical protein